VSRQCDVCGIEGKTSYVYTSYTITWRSRFQDTCQDCHEQKWVSNQKICSSCFDPRKTTGWIEACKDCVEVLPKICASCKQTVDVLDAENECVYCAYSRDWREYPPETLRAKECASCGRYMVLNKDHICQKCHVKEKVKEDSREFAKTLSLCEICDEYVKLPDRYCTHHLKKMRNCVDCGNIFVANQSNQYQCDRCLPMCGGCREVFVPTLRSDVLCDDCTAKERAGVCTSCDSLTRSATADGLCFNCNEERREDLVDVLDHNCWRCKERPAQIDGICVDCRESYFQCPSCGQQNMDYNQYICYECKKRDSS
jgi:hypothetical protein